MCFSLPSKPPYPTGIICSDLQTESPRFQEAKCTEEKRALWPQTPSFNHDPTTFPSCEPAMPPGRGDVTSPVLSFRTARILPCMSRTAVTVKNIKLPRSASKGPQQQFSGVIVFPPPLITRQCAPSFNTRWNAKCLRREQGHGIYECLYLYTKHFTRLQGGVWRTQESPCL